MVNFFSPRGLSIFVIVTLHITMAMFFFQNNFGLTIMCGLIHNLVHVYIHKEFHIILTL